MISYVYTVSASALFFDARVVSTHRTERAARAAFRKLTGSEWDDACLNGTAARYRIGNSATWEPYEDTSGATMLRLRSHSR